VLSYDLEIKEAGDDDNAEIMKKMNER